MDGIVLAPTLAIAQEDMLERGKDLPAFKILTLTQISAEDYVALTSGKEEKGMLN